MITETELITWHLITDALPDDECTVLIHSPRCDPPVWLGFLSAEQWFSVDAMPLRGVTHWADIPDGPRVDVAPAIDALVDFT